ncbi:ankyrin [Corynespora cassiicola Philippines]|uniref:Ankyrin n=1 Tax=Corynespora cassiicola Philippines TaxID=1448308 RepID=A0A2T2NH87_CORCC|nr:ankyrin [Corynespora cassiicola Philippines]
MSKRRAEAEEWSNHQIELEQLYVAENMSLQSVMKHMSTKRNFCKSKAQYERVFFKEWKFKKKNVSKEEWKYIAYRLRERDANQLHSEIEIRGELVPHSKIEKQRRRYELSTIERLAIEHDPSQRPRTPAGVRIFTPRTPSLVLGPSNPVLWEPVAIKIPFEACQIEEASASTPWHQFTRNISQFIHCSRAKSPSPASITQLGAMIPSCGVSSQQTQTVLTISSRFEHTFQDLMSLQFLDIDLLPSFNENDSFWMPSAAFFDPNPYLPLTQSQSPGINIEGISDLIRKDGQVEIIKHAVALLSNNHDVYLIAELVIELCTDQTNLAFLGRLLRNKHSTITAFAEKLLEPAFYAGSYKLIRVLLDSGVSVNQKFPGNLPMLSYALLRNDETLFSIFMEHNAYIEKAYSLGDLLLEWNVTQKFLSFLLEMESRLGKKIIDVDETHIIQLAKSGYFKVIQYLMSRRPEKFDSLKVQPFRLYIAVATPYLNKDYSYMTPTEEIFLMFEILEQSGFDIRKKVPLEAGICLSISALPPDIKLMRYLLCAGIDLGTLSVDKPATFSGPSTTQPPTALVQAVVVGNLEIVQFLIENGANVNKPGPVYPIQVAVIFRRLKILRFILEAGADPSSFLMETFVIDQYGSNYMLYPLHTAIQLALIVGSEEAFDILVEFQADISVKGVCISHASGTYSEGELEKLQSYESWQCKSKQEKISDHICICVWNGVSCNPLLNAALGRNATLFHRVLKMPQIEQFLTRDCLIRCIDIMDWNTVLGLIKLPHFPLDLLHSCQILAASIHANDIEFATRCIKSGNIKKECGNICFAYATYMREISIVDIFLQSGFWPDDPIDKVAEFIFESGRIGGFLDLIPCMNALEISFQEERYAGLRERYLKLYEKLLEQEYDVDALPHLQRVYHLATKKGQLEALKKIPCQIFQMPFHYQASVNELENVDFGFKKDQIQFCSPIQMAAAFGEYDIVQWLLDQNINLQDHESYHSTLQLAIRDGKDQLSQKLLEKGADVNAKPFWKYGATALQFAAMKGHFKLLSIILSKGADLNAPPAYLEGRTALEGASEWGRIDMVSYLLNIGADVRGKDNPNYRRAVYRAMMHGHYVLARMIQDWKNSRYGPEDCDSIESIVESADLELLGYGDGVNFLEELSRNSLSLCICTKRWQDESREKRYQGIK